MIRDRWGDEQEKRTEKKEKLITLTIWVSIFILIVGGVFLMLKLAKIPVRMSGFQNNETSIFTLIFLILAVFLSFLFIIILPLLRERKDLERAEAYIRISK